MAIVRCQFRDSSSSTVEGRNSNLLLSRFEIQVRSPSLFRNSRSCGLFTMTAPTRNFTIVLSLLAISSLIIDASYAFNKCCPPGEVFTGTLKVNCAPAPPNVELFFVNDNGNGYPICEKPEYIATTPLDQLNSMNFFVQVLFKKE